MRGRNIAPCESWRVGGGGVPSRVDTQRPAGRPQVSRVRARGELEARGLHAGLAPPGKNCAGCLSECLCLHRCETPLVYSAFPFSLFSLSRPQVVGESPAAVIAFYNGDWTTSNELEVRDRLRCATIVPVKG